MSAQREFLVIVRAGAKSLHPSWIDVGRPRSFDLLVAAYSENTPVVKDDAVSQLFIPGWKVQGFAELLARMPDLLTKYRYVALIDDDIATKQSDLDRCFAIGKAASLRIWQPSLSWDSYFSHASLLTNPSFKLRYVNFVEMMCPFFEAQYLHKISAVFRLGYETGIDTVWARFMKDAWLKAAVIDEVCVHHTRPVGALKQQQGFRADETYDAQVREVTRLFGVSFGGGIAYGGVDHEGGLTLNRFVLALKATRILLALHRTPMNRVIAARLIAATIRHTLTRRAKIGDLGEFTMERVPDLGRNGARGVLVIDNKRTKSEVHA